MQLKHRVFVLFDRMNACEQILSDSFMEIMGQTAAEMVLGETKGIIPNPFSLIARSSLVKSGLQDKS